MGSSASSVRPAPHSRDVKRPRRWSLLAVSCSLRRRGDWGRPRCLHKNKWLLFIGSVKDTFLEIFPSFNIPSDKKTMCMLWQNKALCELSLAESVWTNNDHVIVFGLWLSIYVYISQFFFFCRSRFALTTLNLKCLHNPWPSPHGKPGEYRGIPDIFLKWEQRYVLMKLLK